VNVADRAIAFSMSAARCAARVTGSDLRVRRRIVSDAVFTD
jgi:hypothetical protein